MDSCINAAFSTNFYPSKSRVNTLKKHHYSIFSQIDRNLHLEKSALTTTGFDSSRSVPLGRTMHSSPASTASLVFPHMMQRKTFLATAHISSHISPPHFSKFHPHLYPGSYVTLRSNISKEKKKKKKNCICRVPCMSALTDKCHWRSTIPQLSVKSRGISLQKTKFYAKNYIAWSTYGNP